MNVKDTKVHLKLRKGDRVRVLTGKDVGKEGAITRVPHRLEPRHRRRAVNVAKKHQRQTKATMQAGIIDKDMPINAGQRRDPLRQVRPDAHRVPVRGRRQEGPRLQEVRR